MALSFMAHNLLKFQIVIFIVQSCRFKKLDELITFTGAGLTDFTPLWQFICVNTSQNKVDAHQLSHLSSVTFGQCLLKLKPLIWMTLNLNLSGVYCGYKKPCASPLITTSSFWIRRVGKKIIVIKVWNNGDWCNAVPSYLKALMFQIYVQTEFRGHAATDLSWFGSFHLNNSPGPISTSLVTFTNVSVPSASGLF